MPFWAGNEIKKIFLFFLSGNDGGTQGIAIYLISSLGFLKTVMGSNYSGFSCSFFGSVLFYNRLLAPERDADLYDLVHSL